MIPSLAGITKELERSIAGPMKVAAKTAGAELESALATSAERAAKKVESARKREVAAAESVEAAERKIASAKADTEAATKKVETSEKQLDVVRSQQGQKVQDAERKIKELRDSGKATADQMEKAETDLRNTRLKADIAIDRQEASVETARRKVITQTHKVEDAEKGLQAARRKSEDAADNVVAAERQLEDALEGSADAAAKGKRSFSELGGSLGELGNLFEGVAGKAGLLGGAVAGVASIGEFVSMGREGAASIGAMNRELGLTGDVAEEMGDEVHQLMRSGVVDGADEAALAVSAMKAQFKDMPVDEIDGLADNLSAFAQTFEMEMEESTQIAGQMIKNGLAPDVESAADLMTAAMQQVPKAMRGEMGDAINEYGVNFSNLGYSGYEAMSMLAGAAEMGQYAIDKTGDAIKEYSVLAIDPAKAEAFEALEMNADEAARAVAEGGAGARETLEATAQALLNMEDPGERAALAVELFGAPIEDLGVDQIPQFLEGLAGTEAGLEDVEGASQRLSDAMANSLSGRLNMAKGFLQSLATEGFMNVWDAAQWAVQGVQNLAGPAADFLTSSYSHVQEHLSVVWKELTEAFHGGDWGYGALAEMIGADNAEWVVDKLSLIKPAWDELLSGFTGGDLGQEVLSSLIGDDLAQDVVGMLSDVGERFFEFRDQVVSALQDAGDTLRPILEWLQAFAQEQLSETLSSLWGAIESVAAAFTSVASAAGGALWEALQGTWDLLVMLWDLLSPLLIPVLKLVAGIVGGALAGSFMFVVGAIRLAAEVVELLAGSARWLIDHSLVPLIDAVSGVIGWFRECSIAADIIKGVLVGLGAAILGSMLPALVRVAAQWVVTGVQATLAAGQQVIAWTMTSASAVKNGVIATGQLLRMGAGWVAAGLQSTAAAVKIAAAWVIGLGPVGWAIAAVAGVVAALVAFFAKTETGQKLWASFTDFLKNAWKSVSETFTSVIESISEWWSGLVTGLSDGWESLKTGVFDAWTATVEGVKSGWSDFTTGLGNAWQATKDTLVAVWETVRTAVFDAFTGYIERVRANWDLVTGALSTAWTWLKDNFLAGWEIIRSLIFDAFMAYVANVRNNFDLVTSAMSAAWDLMKNALHAGYLWIQGTVFDAFGNSLNVLKSWFQSAVEGIRTIWEGLKEAAASPVRFVVNTIWNNGLLKAVDAITKFVPGLNAPEPVKLDFNRGGVLPGYTPGVDPYTFVEQSTGMRIGLSGGEAILRPEATLALGEDWVNNINAAARSGGRAGVENQLRHAHFADGGIFDLGNFNLGGISNLAGALSAIQESHARFVGRFFPSTFHLTSANRPWEIGSYHADGRATDWQAMDGQFATQMPTPMSKALAQAIFTNFPNSAELIHWPLDGWQNLSGGSAHDFGGIVNGQHGNHVHWATHSPLIFDGDDIVLSDMPGGGGGGGGSFIKGIWDKAVGAIGAFQDEDNGSWFSQIPGAFLKNAAEQMWGFITEKIGSIFSGGASKAAEEWSDLASQALKIWGYDDRYLAAMVKQIEIESSGDPNAVNMWDENAVRGTPSAGLLQVIEPTYRDVRQRYPERFEGLPDDRTHPLTNLVAGIGALERDWGGPAGGRWPTRDGYSSGGIFELPQLLTRDFGGWVPDGALVRNTSGRDELMLPPELSAAMTKFFSDYPEAAQLLADAAENIEVASEWLSKAADAQSVEGITARSVASRVLDMDLIAYSGTMKSIMAAEATLLESREGHVARLDAIVEKEEALAAAEAELETLLSDDSGMSVASTRKLEDAQKALTKAQEDAAKVADEEHKDAEKRADAQAKAAEKVADAEEKLKRVREDIEADSEKDALKRDEDVAKATDAVTKAEVDLVSARQESVAALDHIMLPETVGGLIPQISQAAEAIGGHVPEVATALTGLAATALPAGVSLGMALTAFQVALDVAREVWAIAEGILDTFNAYRTKAAELMAESMSSIAAWTQMVDDQRQSVGALRQQQINDQIAMTQANWALRVSQHDQMRAQLEGVKTVAQAQAALDAEREAAARQALWDAGDLNAAFDRYRWAQKIGWEGLLADAVVVTPEILALQHEVNAAKLTAEATQRQAVLNTLTATWEQHKASVALMRTQEQLAVQAEQLARMSGTEFGMNTGEALTVEEIARIAAENARLQGEKDSLGSRARGLVGSWFDWDGDGKIFGIVDNPWSQEQAGYDAAIAANNEQIDRLMESEYGSLTPEQMASMEDIINRAAYQYSQGRDAAGDAIIQGSWLGDAQRAQEVAGLEQSVANWEQSVSELNDSIADSKALLEHETQAQELSEIIAALQAGAASEQYSADALREENAAVREALEALADMEAGVSRAIVEKQPINITLTGDATSNDKVRELLEELNGQSRDLDLRVTQLEEPDDVDPLLVLDRRRRG